MGGVEVGWCFKPIMKWLDATLKLVTNSQATQSNETSGQYNTVMSTKKECQPKSNVNQKVMSTKK